MHIMSNVAMYKICFPPRWRIPGAILAIQRCAPPVAITHKRTFMQTRIALSQFQSRQDVLSTTNKTAISSALFDQLKQFLSNPDPEKHESTKRIIDTMLQHHVYATMPGEEASVMVMVTHAMQEYDSVIAIYQVLRDHNVPPSSITLELVSDACAKTGKYAVALEVIERMHHEADSMLPSAEIYENAIQACHKDGKWIKSMYLFDEMTLYGLQPSRHLYVECLTLCTENKEPTATRKLLAKVENELSKEDLEGLLRTLLENVLKKGDLENAFLLKDELSEKCEWRITKDMLAKMMEVCANDRAWDRAEELLTQYTGKSSYGKPIVYPSRSYTSNIRAMVTAMKTNEIPMSLGLYNSVLREYGRHRMYKEATKLFQEIDKAGLAPNVVSYNAVMQSLDRHIDHVKAWFERLQKQKHLDPTPDTYMILMKSLSRANLWEELITTFQEASQRYPTETDHRIMSIVTVAHARLRNNEEVIKLFCDMKMRGMDLPLHLHGEAMFAYIYNDQWQNALLLFEHVNQSGQFNATQLAQCAIIWDAVILACVRGDQHKQMERYYTELIHNGVRPSVNTIVRLLKHFDYVLIESIWNTFGGEYQDIGIVNETLQRALKKKDLAFAQLVLSEAGSMTAAGCIEYNSMTYSMVLRYFAMKTDVESFNRFCKQMYNDENVTVTVFTYRAILLLLRNLARNSEMEDLLKSCQPISDIIGVCLHGNDITFEEAARLVLMRAEDQGIVCDPVCLEYYIEMCHTVDDGEVVLKLLENGFRSTNSFLMTSDVLNTLIMLLEDYVEPRRICDLLVHVFMTQSSTELQNSALSAFCSVNTPQNVVRLFESLTKPSLLQKDQVVYFIARLMQADAPLEELDAFLRVASKSDLVPLPPSSVALIVEAIANKRFRENISRDDQRSIIQLACSGYTDEQIRIFLKVLGANPELRDMAALFE